ncbi:MAG: radical SAM protein [Candidatus Omnitrophica bacterium]|nr:radical SAM protein [Candidatus Omnitrophota bacterium]
MKYIYGPVSSRRLGLSLGVSLTPYKTCTFDCVYCQLGKTPEVTLQQKEYVPAAEILEELKGWMMNHSRELEGLAYITFAGAGEPTLNTRIGDLISEIKKITGIPVAVITNASLLTDEMVRQSILSADLIVPSLDAPSDTVLQKVNRPHAGITIEQIIDGLIQLKQQYRGKIWLEIMLVRGLNDDLRYIKKLKEIADRLDPDKIQLNSPVRTTTEPDVLPVDRKKLEKYCKMFGEKCEVV